MTDILKKLDDRTTALQIGIEQISSHLHEQIMACPQEGSDEVPPVTTPSVDPLPPGPALGNQTQVDAPPHQPLHHCQGQLLLLIQNTMRCLLRKYADRS